MSDMKISPFAPKQFPTLPPLAGFTMGTAEAGIKYTGRTDVWVLRGQAETQVAGVFTQNACPGAPISWSRKALSAKADGPRLVVVNSGNANVFGGQKSRDAVIKTAEDAAPTAKKLKVCNCRLNPSFQDKPCNNSDSRGCGATAKRLKVCN